MVRFEGILTTKRPLPAGSLPVFPPQLWIILLHAWPREHHKNNKDLRLITQAFVVVIYFRRVQLMPASPETESDKSVAAMPEFSGKPGEY